LKLFVCFIPLFFLFQNSYIFGQVINPDMPENPVINGDIDTEVFKFKVRIAVQGRGDLQEETVILSSDTLISSDNKRIKIKDVFKISVISWEKRTRLNKHVFYPLKYEILLRDYKKIIHNGNIELFNRLKTSNKKSGYIYLYYHDYFKNGKWINSGETDFNSPVSRPADGCCISIELIQ